MSTPDIERLQSIKTLPSLIAYLRDDLGWPIAADDIEEVFFDYDPAELGLAADQAAKVKEIKQLRPLDSKQPWGIFWINFEKKRLPVVILRRILGHLVVKKRASANKAAQRAWHLNDLLFISAYGEDSDRAITFAHFAQEAESPGDLSVLKVLGWDGGDTVLHLADAHRTLSEKLRWPDDPRDIAAWRDQWGRAFTLRHREVITTTQELVEELAQLATSIRKRADTILARESDRGPMRRLYAAFKTALIHDLREDDFADVIAQTISYGLLTARFSRPAGISVQNLVDMVPPTNPFLRELLGEFLAVAGRKKGMFDFDELGIQDVVGLLNRANAEAVKSDFGNRTNNEDPIIHFYEHFLAVYDKRKKIQRGVFFTPQPVVSYIVRSVHELLRTEFALEDGLADTTTWGEVAKRNTDLRIPDGAKPGDPFVLILDPATGTATFLVEVIEVIHKTLTAKWKAQGHGEKKIEALWNEYVPKHLLPRLHGYELLMAPYAIAHLKIGLKLNETGYHFGSDERARIYLTNALEPAHDFSGSFEFAIPALAHEARAVNEVKRRQRFTVVVGNPPYSSSSQNRESWAMQLIEDYKTTVREAETQIQALSDDYVKFMRYAQLCSERSGCGIVGFITNNNFQSATTFRDMRGAILSAFNVIHLVDLHGNGRLREVAQDGTADENVFDILAGVCVSVLTSWPRLKTVRTRTDLLGTRQAKYDWLTKRDLSSVPRSSFAAAPPQHSFQSVEADLATEYEGTTYLPELFGTGKYQDDKTTWYGSGFKTQQDEFAIGFTRSEIRDNVYLLLDPRTTDKDLRDRFVMCATEQWSFDLARRELRSTNWEELLCPCVYRPFDVRFTVLHRGVVSNPRTQVMSQFLRPNLGICVGRQGQAIPGTWDIVFATRHPEDQNLFYRGGNTNFPLFWFHEPTGLGLSSGKRHNLSSRFLGALSGALSLSKTPGTGLPVGITAEDVLHFVYSVLHSVSYRTRYAEFLKVDFPRIPLPGSLALFRDLVSLGDELVALHVMESPKLDRLITTYTGPKNPEVGRVGWSDDAVWLDAAATKKGQRATPGTVGFHGVPEAVWEFHIGGYQVCEKWLKDRKGRKLLKADIEHYQRIVVALNETIRLMQAIDEVIDRHGGWPAAFAVAG